MFYKKKWSGFLFGSTAEVGLRLKKMIFEVPLQLQPQWKISLQKKILNANE